ncbi:putative choline transporter, neither null mutation nor overexpression affects choline transport [Coemansia sp. RSA 2708]|nr:putative choline transporter, neither null mutation nor overexpression affects choline transport [Coemansia sp. RSA 2708]KAJ2310182.1 putative choline transporter, neither null mutation nor overexpression affects choline transport [Coemansia sp. RSA 2705]KAJ2317575.1 putative choline transporter, neither null mutation nor overexpression affects choline transport [Coemansia sp. RSA 2704]KAJ2365195.1 putative choline transporter, neither null mutation nor overexpression affects choline transpor
MSYNYNNSYYPPPQQSGYPPPPPPPEQQQQPYGYYGGDQYQQPQHQQPQYQQPPPPPPPDTYYPPPQNYGNGGDFKGAKQYNREPKFRDLWAALLFLAQFALFVVIAALFIKSLPSTTFKHSGNLSYTKNFYSWPTMIMWLCVLLVSIVFSLIYLGLMQMFAGQMLIISFWFAVVSMIGTGVYYLAAKIWFAGGIMLIFGILYALMWFSWRHRIPFSKLVLEVVCHITRRFPSTIVVSVAFLILQAAYSAFWSLAFAGSFKHMEQYQNCSTHTDRNGRQYQSCSNPKQILAWVFMVFSFYWTSGVILNVLHTTICGTFATFYFFEGSPQGYPTKHVTLSSLKRAMTSSFGSICFGSLVVAIIQTLRAIVRAIRSQNDDNLAAQLLACCADCILGCIEAIVEFFNKYAYVEIAVYGKPFMAAAKDTWTLIKDRGVDALINDCLIGNVLQMGAFLCAAVVALVAWLYITITKPEYNTSGSYTAPIIIAAFVLAMSMFMVLLKCIDSGAATTFVCLAEDPDAMARNNPRLFAMVREAYPRVVQGVHAVDGF